jgi:predicted RNA methylase
MVLRFRELVHALSEVKTWEKPRVELEQYPTPPDLAAHMLFAAYDEGDVEDALVADLGCGGCVLGIAAALLGAAHVVGVDIDPAALRVAAQNVDAAEVCVDLLACDVLQLAMRSFAATEGVGDSNADSSQPAGTRATLSAVDAAAEAANRTFPCFIESTYPTKVQYASAKAAAVAAARAGAMTEDANAKVSAEELIPIGRGAFDLVLMNPPFGTQQHSNGIDMRFLRAGLAMCTADGAVYSLNKTSTRAYIAKTAAAWGVSSRVVAELQFEIPKMYKHHKHESLDVAVDFWRFSPGLSTDQEAETPPGAVPRPLSSSSSSSSSSSRGGPSGKGMGRGRVDSRIKGAGPGTTGSGRGRGKGGGSSNSSKKKR